MSRILIVTTNYWPEPTGIAVYTTDLANILTRDGHEVSVLTSLPHYPWWRIPEEFKHMGPGLSEQSDVRVIRAKHIVPSTMNVVQRMRFEFSLWRNLLKASKQLKSEDFELVLACIPTVAAGLVAKSVASRLKISFGLIIQDLSGAGAKQSGLRGGASIAKLAERVEGLALHAADALVVVSPAMGDVVESLGIEKKKITLIYNYSARNIAVEDKVKSRLKFGWGNDDFIVIHTGNMGAKQDLGNVVSAADCLPSGSKIKILLVGHGNQEDTLSQMCSGKANISLMPAVSDADYSALLSAADLLLVNERSTQLEMSLPSKLTSYLYSQRPVLAAVPRGGATWKFLDGVAHLVDAGNPESLAQAIMHLEENPVEMQHLSERGLEFAESNLSLGAGRNNYREWVNQLLKKPV
jgi:glycosyltransferase involved in cell wall biosynthesis